MIERSEKIIKHATLSKIRMQRPGVVSDIYNSARINPLDAAEGLPRRMMRHGRKDFARDTPWQWNRPGRR